ncbi:MAG TPA: alpha/beta hydrolase [Candidatus Omnitrophota bacterium]|nr:alpha/beta hydrolase [Candidatus Omnitrophota bacterium]HPS36594.1 alpha/beta hydrolase [Candidatus Omnitrophota bacterium]
MKHPLLLSLLLSFLFFSCATLSPDFRRSKAEDIARGGGLQKTTVRADPFVLTAYSRITAPGKPLRIYIEGDGYAFVTRSRVSGDPTPREPLALELAAEDPSVNVVYLARPCQFTPMEQNPKCEEFYWTDGRFSDEVIRSMDAAVSYFVKQTGASGIDLVGYSGGAAVAILVTARRQDVLSLRTVAGNLDPEVVNEYHGVSPLEGSLDPAAVAGQIASIPQLHFVGGEDSIIPFEAVSAYLKKMGDERCFQTKTLPDATHAQGWTESWKEQLNLPVFCRE